MKVFVYVMIVLRLPLRLGLVASNDGFGAALDNRLDVDVGYISKGIADVVAPVVPGERDILDALLALLGKKLTSNCFMWYNRDKQPVERFVTEKGWENDSTGFNRR